MMVNSENLKEYKDMVSMNGGSLTFNNNNISMDTSIIENHIFTEPHSLSK